MMHDPEKSDPPIVATKPANAPASASKESVERRGGAEGNASQRGMRRTPSRESMTSGLEQVRIAAKRYAVRHPRWEPDALIGHVRFCAGGRQ